MKEKIDLPKDLKITKPKKVIEWERYYDPVPWIVQDIYGAKMAKIVLKEQFKLRAATSRLEAEYLEKMAKIIG